MTLRTRIIGIAAAVILLAVAASDGVIWMICRRALLNEAEQTALQKTYSLETDFQNFQNKTNCVTGDLELEFFCKQRGDDYLICLHGGREIFNQTVLTIGELQDIHTRRSSSKGGIMCGYLQKNGRMLFATKLGHGSNIVFYCVSDFSAVTRRLRLLALGMLGVLMCVFLPAVILLYLLLCRVLSPLKSLSASAQKIAAGAYGERVPVTGTDEVGMLAADFNKMAGAIQEKIASLADSEQRKTIFMADFSHELKTPLTAISGYAQTLRTVRLSEDDRAEALGYIVSESKRLDRLSKKMMRLMQLDTQSADSLQTDDIDCNKLLDAVLASCEPVAGKKGIRLEKTACGGTIRGDFDLLHDALYNLTENAVKASSSDETVSLSAENGCITVADHGCGIPPEELKNITEPFYMVDKSRSRANGGAGLGLSLVKQIIQLHGAEMHIESEPGRGTAVKLHFVYNSLNT